MSYNGTVTCSHCYQRGHNKRKCPSLTEEIKGKYDGNSRMAVKERAAGNENDAQWYDDTRRNVSPAIPKAHQDRSCYRREGYQQGS